jgi:hypothetical protein
VEVIAGNNYFSRDPVAQCEKNEHSFVCAGHLHDRHASHLDNPPSLPFPEVGCFDTVSNVHKRMQLSSVSLRLEAMTMEERVE